MRYQGKWLCPSGFWTSPSKPRRLASSATSAHAHAPRSTAPHPHLPLSTGFPTPHAAGSPRDPEGLGGEGLPVARGTASRAKGESPDDRSLEALLILSGLFLAVALVGVVAITLTLVPRSSQAILKPGPSGPRGESLRRCRDLLQASAAARRQERGDPRGIRRPVSRLVAASPGPEEAGLARACGSIISRARSSTTRRSKDRAMSCSRTRWPKTSSRSRSTGPRRC